MQIHISNLHSNLIEPDVQRLFIKYGEVASVNLMRDKINNRSLGRAFLDMPVQKEASAAVISLNGTNVKGKKIVVVEVVYDPASNASWRFSRNV